MSDFYQIFHFVVVFFYKLFIMVSVLKKRNMKETYNYEYKACSDRTGACKKRAPIRLSGILLHPTSFPSPYGIGDLGPGAYDFIDFLAASGQHLWQVLPLGPTGFGDSPYQGFSAFAGQPLIISPDLLIKMDLLTKEDIASCEMPQWDPRKVDYGPWPLNLRQSS